jgi:hypothetical protein
MSGPEAAPPLAGRLWRAGEMRIGLSGSPLPTCREDADQRGYLVHSLAARGRAGGRERVLEGGGAPRPQHAHRTRVPGR